MTQTTNNYNPLDAIKQFFMLLVLIVLLILVLFGCTPQRQIVTVTETKDSIVYVTKEVHDTIVETKTIEVEAQSTVEKSEEKDYTYSILVPDESGELKIKEQGVFHYSGKSKTDSTSYYKQLYNELLTKTNQEKIAEMYAYNDNQQYVTETTDKEDKWSKYVYICVFLGCIAFATLYFCYVRYVEK